MSLRCLALSYLGDLSCVVMCNGCLVMSSFLLPTLLAYYFLFSFEMDCPVLLSCLGFGLGRVRVRIRVRLG